MPSFSPMNNHKLIQTLKTFNKKEWREFSRFVESPYFNTDKHCIRLLGILKKEFVKKDGFQVSRTRLERLFSRNGAADASLLNVKLSLLTRLAEQFLVQYNFESQNLYRKHLLLEEFLGRGLNNHFERAYKKDACQHKVPKKVSPGFYRNKLLIEHDFTEYITVHKKKMGVRENIQEVSDTLDIYYLLEKIDLFTNTIPLENMYNKEYDSSTFELLETLIQRPRFASHPLLRVYYAAFQMIKFRDNALFFNKLWKLLEANGQFIEASSLYKLYCLCANYCIEKVVAGQVEFHQNIYEVYRKIEEEELFLLEGYVDIGLLRNTINIALKVGESEWAEYVLEKYKNKIAPDSQESVYMYCKSVIAFHQKKYDETIGHLSGVQNISDMFDIGIKFMLMKAYYEHDDDFCYRTEQVFRSFKAFVKQHRELAKSRKEGCINFANILINLYRIKHGEGRNTLDTIRKKMEQCELIVDKYWLTKKAEELTLNNGSSVRLAAAS